MRLPILVFALLLLCAAPRQAHGQNVGSIHRLQRIVGTLHLHQLIPDSRVGRPHDAATDDLLIDRRALLSASLATLRHQMRLPLNPRADLTLIGRLGRLGPSTQMRVRLRF